MACFQCQNSNAHTQFRWGRSKLYEVGQLVYEVGQLLDEVVPLFYEVGQLVYEVGQLLDEVSPLTYEVGPLGYGRLAHIYEKKPGNEAIISGAPAGACPYYCWFHFASNVCGALACA